VFLAMPPFGTEWQQLNRVVSLVAVSMNPVQCRPLPWWFPPSRHAPRNGPQFRSVSAGPKQEQKIGVAH